MLYQQHVLDARPSSISLQYFTRAGVGHRKSVRRPIPVYLPESSLPLHGHKTPLCQAVAAPLQCVDSIPDARFFSLKTHSRYQTIENVVNLTTSTPGLEAEESPMFVPTTYTCSAPQPASASLIFDGGSTCGVNSSTT